MIKQAGLYIFCMTGLVFGNDKAIMDSLRTALHRPPGTMMEIRIEQQQYGQDWIEHAEMEIIAPGNYLLDTPEQQVKVLGQDIFTWNKVSNQVVIDQVNRDEISILDFLSGDFELMDISKLQKSGKEMEILFNIPDNGISGLLTINLADYLPRKLEFYYSEDDRIILNIQSITTLPALTRFIDFDLEGKEIIDLRE
ncbi:MAG: hypothetical protein KAK01_06200 [Candidatus Marinimicrobia bacterium]|nr:hypothetical protein [Candidatus Neomarinimicrobiota bacterium]